MESKLLSKKLYYNLNKIKKVRYNIYMSIELTKAEIDYLLNLEKHCISSDTYKFPDQGGKIEIPLISSDKHEEFKLDIFRSSINLSKNTFQNRARKTISLLRLDLGGAPHRNPDGKVVTGNHLHVYKEGFGDKYAYPLPEEFIDCKDINDFLEKFMNYCNIVNKPIIEEDLFI